jgi:hypothetical protein
MSAMNQDNDSPQGTAPDRQADDRLVHALLVHLHDDQVAAHREERVERALRAVREQGPAPAVSPIRARRFPAWARWGVWAAAAMVLAAVGAWVVTYGPTPAMASLDDILGALGRPGDRTYRIHMEDQPAPPERGPPEDREPQGVPRPGLDEATLYLRDGGQYVMARHDPNGGMTFDGYDGRQSWRIRAGVLEGTKEGLGAGGIPMPPIMADVPFSDLHQTLERIRVDYAVEQFDQAPLPSGDKEWRHVRVRRNSREVKGPETIEIWADPKTAMPQHIVFDRAKLQGNREPCRLTFDLVSEGSLSPDWFSPAPHLAEGTGFAGPDE